MRIISEKEYREYREVWFKFEQIFSKQLEENKQPKKVFYFIHDDQETTCLKSCKVNEEEIKKLLEKWEKSETPSNIINNNRIPLLKLKK